MLGDPESSLVSLWRSENNPLDSIGSNHGTLQSGATFGVGKYGQAFSFNGVNSYVDVPYNASLDLQGSITLAAWINSSNITSYRGIAGKAGGYQIYIDGGLLTFSFYNGSWTHLSSSIAIPENVWVHVAGTFNSTDGTMQLYINGVPDTGLVTAQRLSANANSVMIGGFGVLGAPFSGFIDEVAIYNRALTSNEIALVSDMVPDAFSFIPQTGMPLNTMIISSPITVAALLIRPQSASAAGSMR